MMYEAPADTSLPASVQTTSPHAKPIRKKKKKQDYSYWLAGPYNTVRGEQALWTAVITQAMMDALSNSRNPEIIFQKNEAIRWLTENNKDFPVVCLLAGLEPEYVRVRAKRSIANPVAWRAEAGTGKRYEERKAYRNRMKQRKSLTLKTLPPSAIHALDTVITGCW